MKEIERTEQSEQREIIRKLLLPQPTVVGIEGGPCSGKTTFIKKLEEGSSGRQVVCLPEAATHHIEKLALQGIEFAGLAQRDRDAYLNVEKKILKSIVADIESAMEVYAGTDAIIVADRTDIGAYVTNSEYSAILAELGLEMPPMLSHVDQMHYLPTVARMKPELYGALKSSNQHRVEEDSQEAVEVCIANQAAVARHPEFHMLWQENFEATIDAMVSCVLHPEQESEVKLKPIVEGDATYILLQGGELMNSAEIEQTYYELDDQVFRLRRTQTDHGEILYAFTIKHGDGITRKEIQRKIDCKTFDLLSQCDQIGEPLHKNRTMALLDDSVEPGRRRLWAFDRYYDRRLPEWNLETDVADEAEAHQVTESLFGYERAQMGAEKLARMLGQRSLVTCRW
jgi:hypothetical protein